MMVGPSLLLHNFFETNWTVCWKRPTCACFHTTGLRRDSWRHSMCKLSKVTRFWFNSAHSVLKRAHARSVSFPTGQVVHQISGLVVMLSVLVQALDIFGKVHARPGPSSETIQIVGSLERDSPTIIPHYHWSIPLGSWGNPWSELHRSLTHSTCW